MDSSASMMWTLLRSTPVICGNVVRTTGVPPCLPANQPPTHFRFRRNGRHRASVPRRSLSLDDLANAARQHDQLVDRHDGHRAIDDLFEPGGGTPAPCAGRAAPCRVSRHGGAALSLFNVWRARARWLEMNF